MKREEITDLDFIEILKKESHYNHEIIQDEKGRLFWKPDGNLCAEIESKNINDYIFDFNSNGSNKNSEEYRKFYRDMGYSLFRYWEIFYCKANNPICNDYRKNSK